MTNFNIFAVSFCVLAFVCQYVDSVKCYQCTTGTGASDIGGPCMKIDKSATTVKDSCDHCSTLEGEGIAARACETVAIPSGQKKSDCQTGDVKGKKMTGCYCEGDLCNNKELTGKAGVGNLVGNYALLFTLATFTAFFSIN